MRLFSRNRGNISAYLGIEGNFPGIGISGNRGNISRYYPQIEGIFPGIGGAIEGIFPHIGKLSHAVSGTYKPESIIRKDILRQGRF